MYLIKRDNIEVARVQTPDLAFAWLVRNTNQSVAYAVKYDGYTVTTETGSPVVGFRKEDHANYRAR